MVAIPNRNSPLTIGGALMAAFGLVVGLLVLFVIPGRYRLFSGIQLIILGTVFVIGLLILLLGLVWSPGKKRN
ncbi:MAG: hypothetical protein HW402_208 [Dehalococcoidales bacterium]|nr:hypothetical protein [Dehalococcoidales bacterium]